MSTSSISLSTTLKIVTWLSSKAPLDEMNNYKIIGYGNAGRNIINSLLLNKFEAERLFYFDTDVQSLSISPLVNKFQIGAESIAGLGTEADVKKGKQSFKESEELFRRLTTEDALYIIVGALGGGTFTGAGEMAAEFLQNDNKKFLIITTLPFQFEGNKRNRQAVDFVKNVNAHTDRVIVIKNDDLNKDTLNKSLDEAFRQSDNTIVEIIKEILSDEGSETAAGKEAAWLTQKLEDRILEIKAFVKEHEYLISTVSSKVILANTNLELLKALTIDKDLVYTISPRKFEELCAYIYELSGMKTELTQSTRDNGADFIVWTPPPVLGNSFKTVVQTKRYAKQRKVGSPEIRELIGTQIIFNADRAQIITTSDYSKAAITTAREKKIDLVKFYELNDHIKNIIDAKTDNDGGQGEAFPF